MVYMSGYFVFGLDLLEYPCVFRPFVNRALERYDLVGCVVGRKVDYGSRTGAQAPDY
jgi:hypothetical protein